ncbi:MAG TPA: phosphate-starvation-inducible PsiE family protein [Ktedonobacteraceae bacterium]
MSNLVTNTNEPEHNPNAATHHEFNAQVNKPHGSIAYFSALILEKSDSLIYAIVGICFFLGGLFALGYSFWDFIKALIPFPTATAIVAGAIIKLVSDLLLVLIIMEVLGTVIHYLKSHATSLRPFLFIGIISATRGILSIGARLSVETVSPEEFNRSMIELGVNALAILALGITLKLLGKLVEDHS